MNYYLSLAKGSRENRGHHVTPARNNPKKDLKEYLLALRDDESELDDDQPSNKQASEAWKTFNYTNLILDNDKIGGNKYLEQALGEYIEKRLEQNGGREIENDEEEIERFIMRQIRLNQKSYDVTFKWKKRYSRLYCNTNENIANYIIWTFDDAFIPDDAIFTKKSILREYARAFKETSRQNKIDWIKIKNSEQVTWIYTYLNREYDFSFISPPTNEKQLYNTVIVQLDLICDLNRDKPAEWDFFLKKLKKRWSTQSDRLKKRKAEIKLDKDSIKMLQKIIGKGATPTMLKIKLKDLITAAHTAAVEQDT